MSKKKEHKLQPEEIDEVRAEAAESAPESGEQAEAEIEALQKRIEEAEARSAEYLDGWQRVQAEFVNYKKRVERDREADYLALKGDLIKRILPLVDDLERALQNRPGNGEVQAWAEGVELIYRKMQSILEAEGVRRIEAEGQMFDPNFHEAISHEPVDGQESGRIIAVVQHGYMLGERVIRPAMVRVAQ